MMDDLGRQVDRILEVIEVDLKDILWNKEKELAKSICGDYEVNTELQGDTISIKIGPRRVK